MVARATNPTLVCSVTTEWFVWGDVGSSELHFYAVDTQAQGTVCLRASLTECWGSMEIVKVSILDSAAELPVRVVGMEMTQLYIGTHACTHTRQSSPLVSCVYFS